MFSIWERGGDLRAGYKVFWGGKWRAGAGFGFVCELPRVSVNGGRLGAARGWFLVQFWRDSGGSNLGAIFAPELSEREGVGVGGLKEARMLGC
jgi:hypothetical protein